MTRAARRLLVRILVLSIHLKTLIPLVNGTSTAFDTITAELDSNCSRLPIRVKKILGFDLSSSINWKKHDG